MSKTIEKCGVCNKKGAYDHENDENGDMTLLLDFFDYVHWDCYDRAIKTRESITHKR